MEYATKQELQSEIFSNFQASHSASISMALNICGRQAMMLFCEHKAGVANVFMTGVTVLEVQTQLGNNRAPLPLDKPPGTHSPQIWHNLPAYVKDSRSGLDSCLEFIQEIAEIHRLMGEKQREKEESLSHRG